MEASREQPHSTLPFWLEDIRPEHLPEVYRDMASVIGMRQTFELAEAFAGSSVYFPRLEHALRDARNNLIRREYTGANIKSLARRWRLSVRHLRAILHAPQPRGH